MKKHYFPLIVSLLCLMQVKLVMAAPVLVDIDWLKSNLNDDDIVIVDMTSDEMSYSRYHIPGAIRLSYSDIVMKRKDKVSVMIPHARLAKIMGFIGVSNDTHVVIYDDMGGLHAGRLFWQLERLGHKKVSVLDGGIVSWVLAGNKVTNVPVKPKKASYEFDEPTGSINNALLEDVIEAQQKEDVTLLDVRSEEEYIGHRRFPRSGHMPGAVWMPWENALDVKNGFKLTNDGEMRKQLKQLGITKQDQPVIAYCRSGHRASQTYLTLRHLGFSNIRLYDGSMSEYQKKRHLPVIKGKNPE